MNKNLKVKDWLFEPGSMIFRHFNLETPINLYPSTIVLGPRGPPSLEKTIRGLDKERIDLLLGLSQSWVADDTFVVVSSQNLHPIA